MSDPKDKADLDNHANQLNPNNDEYRGDDYYDDYDDRDEKDDKKHDYDNRLLAKVVTFADEQV